MLCREKQVNICSASRFCVSCMNTVSLFWRDVTFYKQITWKVGSLFWWCECLLLVDAHLGISASKANLQFWFHQIPFDLGDDVWWPLVMYGETVVHHLLFLVGKLLIWFTFIFYTKHWCPLAAFDNFEIHCWMGAWVGPGWVGPWAWGCPAGVLAAWPWCHLSKNTKYEFH